MLEIIVIILEAIAIVSMSIVGINLIRVLNKLQVTNDRLLKYITEKNDLQYKTNKELAATQNKLKAKEGEWQAAKEKINKIFNGDE